MIIKNNAPRHVFNRNLAIEQGRLTNELVRLHKPISLAHSHSHSLPPTLSHSHSHSDIFRISKVIKEKTVRGKKQYFVKWRGYDDSYNSWVDEEDITENFDNEDGE